MLGALISAGSSILGGILGNKSAKDAQKANLAAQREFAKNGIQYRVQDAKKAGIHPLYALGANTHSFTPSFVGSNSLAEGVAQAGQDIGRAVTAGMTSNEKNQATMDRLTIQRAELENTKLASEIALMNQPGSGPNINQSSLIPGQGSTPVIGEVTMQPTQTGSRQDERLHAGAGTRPDLDFLQTGDGGFAPVPSKEAAEAIESSIFASGAHALRNMVIPSISNDTSSAPAKSLLPDWANTWTYSITRQAWYPAYNPNLGDR